MDIEKATAFADHWIEAWNNHDLDSILSHYTDDFEMSSPVMVESMGELTGKLKGKTSVREYWAKALARYPELHFEKLHTLVGVDSVTIVYNGVRGLSAEVFYFDKLGKVHSACAHYEL